MKNFRSLGATVEWTNAGDDDVASGEVVTLENCLGVAVADIPAGESGTLAIEGVFDLPKTAGEAIVVGESLVWLIEDGDGAAVGELWPHGEAPKGDVLIGPALAMAAAGEDDTTVLAKLTPVNVAQATNAE